MQSSNKKPHYQLYLESNACFRYLLICMFVYFVFQCSRYLLICMFVYFVFQCSLSKEETLPFVIGL